MTGCRTYGINTGGGPHLVTGPGFGDPCLGLMAYLLCFWVNDVFTLFSATCLQAKGKQKPRGMYFSLVPTSSRNESRNPTRNSKSWKSKQDITNMTDNPHLLLHYILLTSELGLSNVLTGYNIPSPFIKITISPADKPCRMIEKESSSSLL